MVRDGDHYALLGRRRLERSAKTNLAQAPQVRLISRSCVKRAMIRIWLLLNYPERTADSAQTLHCGNWDAWFLPEDCTIRSPPKCHLRRKSRRTKRLLLNMRPKWKVSNVQACSRYCYSLCVKALLRNLTTLLYMALSVQGCAVGWDRFYSWRWQSGYF